MKMKTWLINFFACIIVCLISVNFVEANEAWFRGKVVQIIPWSDGRVMVQVDPADPNPGFWERKKTCYRY